MINAVITLLILAVLFAVLGFTTIAGTFAWLAKIIFFVFLVLFLIAAVMAAMRGRAPV